jgi:phage gp29-like protein
VPRRKSSGEEEVWDVELVEALGRSEEGFEKLIAKCEAAMAIRVLGQNLTTEVKEGSRAAASVHERVAGRKLAADATATTACLREQLFRPWAHFNFGDAELAPWPAWDSTPPEDKAARANTLKTFGEALKELAAGGLKVDLATEAERFGVAILGTTEPAQPPEKPATEPGAETLSRGVLLASPTVRGREYLDRLHANTVAEAAQVLATDVAEVLGAIDDATSFEDLKQRLLDGYRGMDSAPLVALTRRAWELAELAGRAAIKEQVS